MGFSPAETASFIVNALLTFFSTFLGLVVVVVMFIVGMVQGGNWMYVKSTGLGFALGLVMQFILGAALVGVVL